MSLPSPFSFAFPEDAPENAPSTEALTLDSPYAEWLKGSPKLNALTAGMLEQKAAIATAVQTSLQGRMLDSAVGVALDDLGEIVGQVRAGADDDTYRKRVKARIRINRSSGTPEDLYSVYRPFGLGMQYAPFYPASLEFRLYGVSSAADAVVFGAFLQLAKAAGVGASLLYSESAVADTFTLDIGPGLDVGHLAGSV